MQTVLVVLCTFLCTALTRNLVVFIYRNKAAWTELLTAYSTNIAVSSQHTNVWTDSRPYHDVCACCCC